MSADKQLVEEAGVPELVEDEEVSNGSEAEEAKEWDDWQADGEDESAARTKCVACDEILESAEAALAHLKEKHGFDLVSFVKASSSDASLRMYNYIKAVNYLRSKGHQEVVKIEGEEWKSDVYLKSNTTEEDPLLFFDIDEDDSDSDATFHLPASAIPSSSQEAQLDLSKLSREELEKALSSALSQQSASSQKLAILEQHLTSLQRLNKSLLDGTKGRERK